MKINDTIRLHLQIEDLILSDDTNELLSCTLLDIESDDYSAIPWITDILISYRNLIDDPLLKRLFVLDVPYFEYDISQNAYFDYNHNRIDLDKDFFNTGFYVHTNKTTETNRNSKRKETIFDITSYKNDKIILAGEIIECHLVDDTTYMAPIYNIIVAFAHLELKLQVQLSDI
jgi:hypothetical protein